MILENRTYDEIAVGEAATLTRTITEADVQLFAAFSGDVNPAHLDSEYATATPFKGLIAHGMITGSLISTVLGTQLPGPGTIYVEQQLRFRRPVHFGDKLTVTLRCTEKVNAKKRVRFDCECVNQNGEIVTSGVAEVIAPTEKIRREAHATPQVSLGGLPYAVRG
ncbi:MAG: MaoC/PaaZ C-terminal domain-containing protein [Rhodocyclaceae bacterium]